MALAAEKEMKHLGESKGCADHDHDLVHELGRRLDAIWRYDQYIANAEDKPQLQSMWREFKKQEEQNVRRLKQSIAEEIHGNCF